MVKRLLFFLMLTLTLQAAMPKTYSSIGDPIYRAVGPVETLAAQKTFREEGELFSAYVREAKAAEQEGRWLDTHLRLPEAKARSASYLKTLRHLQKLNAQITGIVREKTMDAIRQHHSGTYFAIKKSGFTALITDPELQQASRRFENRLKTEQKRKAEQDARRKEDFLRTYGNLKGDWHSSSSPGNTIVYRFVDTRRIMIIKEREANTQTMEGTWRIDDDDVMHIALETITHQKTGGIPHQRTADVKLQMQIRDIGQKKMTLFDVRRKTLLVFLR